jgi:ABC-type phosphate/phosphonate transport system substrate-binding protein
MKQFGIAALLLAGLALTGCGSSNSNSNANNVNGNWNASLVSGDNTSMFQFGTSLMADKNGVLTISSFDLTTNFGVFRGWRD